MSNIEFDPHRIAQTGEVKGRDPAQQKEVFLRQNSSLLQRVASACADVFKKAFASFFRALGGPFRKKVSRRSSRSSEDDAMQEASEEAGISPRRKKKKDA